MCKNIINNSCTPPQNASHLNGDISAHSWGRMRQTGPSADPLSTPISHLIWKTEPESFLSGSSYAKDHSTNMRC